ncbi:MAG: alpha/beta hydrolase [Salinisphaera sp.]|nr:alpha/beta hydrolase [Salinisphaera sp.]
MAASNPQVQVKEEGDDLAERAANAVGATEDPGAFDVRELMTAAGSLLEPGRVARQTVQLGLELIRILAGISQVEIDPRDRRFKDPAWAEHPVYRRLGQAYMAYCRAVDESVASVGNGDWRNRERLNLLADVLTSSLSPTNTLIGNPAALKHAFDTGGASLLRGLRSFVDDLRHNGGMPRHLDDGVFTVGKDLALSAGAVVFRNEILEIIQYNPQTAKVYERPILLMTPQINKFYFLDLAPERSFVEYAVKNGIQVFMVSWRNPSREHADWNLDSYCQALLEASDAVRSITGTEDLNTFGFCAGGITMTALLAHLADVGDERVHSASYAVTLLDFSVPTMIGGLQSKPLLRHAAGRSRRKGVIEGKDLKLLFSWFRPNDLVWNYWVNNVLMGKTPPAFDILAWNADPTNLPAGLHGDFLELFANNHYVNPGAFNVLGSPADLSKIKIDNFVTGAVSDHLTPWKACYRTTQLLNGPSSFVLSNAGHVASLVNPPSPKASYFVGRETVPDPEAWYETAEKRQGSWWEHWVAWVQPRSGEQRNAPRKLGNRAYPPLDAAPGTYIFEQPN